MKNEKNPRHDLHIFLGIVAALLIIGFIFIYSASSVFADQQFGNPSYFLKKHIVGLLMGTCALIIARLTPFVFVKKLAPLGYWAALGLTAITLIPSLAMRIHGSSRWLNLAGFSFQPSELLKVMLILYVSYLLTKKEFQQHSFIHGYIPLLVILGIPSLILLKQPDFGMMVTLICTVCIMIFASTLYARYLLWTIAGLIPIGIGLIALYPYRMRRILTFLNPWADPQGSGFQIIQSLIAIGSGGILGLGIGNSQQKFFYLPMQHTDFIFSIIAEETGLLGSAILIILFMLFLYFGLRISNKLTNPFSRYSTLGFTVVMSLQAVINIAVATGLAPTKGIGLPFVSYGNSALICQLLMIGLIINMARQ